ncbi:MAG: SDR family oxidoreductase [Betaproteobacteria bacterium]|nr:SDR family oxidoreductase [Betaproteobacteria bacterium]
MKESLSLLPSLPERYRALVFGATGALGGAFAEFLADDPRCARVERLARGGEIPFDFGDESALAAAAASLSARGPFHLMINAAGVLHTPAFLPEKRLADLNLEQMRDTFVVNCFGPALAFKHFAPLLAPDRAVFATLSAKVGSIGDNRLGGWYSYRASKAALNMMVKTAAIELKRTRPHAILVALHPGTVNTRLSKPFRGEEIGRAPDAAAGDLLRVIDALAPDDSGSFIAYDGTRLPW